jgi:hypothetical protein
MIPIGYIAKIIEKKPTWINNPVVEEVCSVSSCISDDFCDYIEFWKHNGFWFFNSPDIIFQISKENNIILDDTTLFYFEAYGLQTYEDDPIWEKFFPEKSFETNVLIPDEKELLGYDIVSFSQQSSPECSYLSCNSMADEVEVNKYCLIDNLEMAIKLLNEKKFEGCEPGPCRIIAVYKIDIDLARGA